MNYGELIVIALALAVDAATYAFSYGLALRQKRGSSALLLAVSVGVFQAGMPLLGYMGGVGLRSAVAAWGRWFVLLVFLALGISIIYKTWLGKDDGCEPKPLSLLGLLLVGLATSMDAFAVGICLALGTILGESLTPWQLAMSVSVIGLAAFAAALIFFHLSRLLHHLPERWLQTAAALLLIFLGLHQM